jgi:AcrR family transcriptional regulator
VTALERPPVPPASGGLRDRRNRRGELLEAAIHVFYVKSFAGASVQDIAEAVGVLKGSVYHYVTSKDELLEQIFALGKSELDRRLLEVREFDGSPEQRLRRFVEVQVRWYLEHYELAIVLFREYPYLAGDSRRLAVARREEYVAFVGELVSGCRREGTCGVEETTRFVLGAIEAAREWHARAGFQRPAVAARAYADLVLRAVRF